MHVSVDERGGEWSEIRHLQYVGMYARLEIS